MVNFNHNNMQTNARLKHYPLVARTLLYHVTYYTSNTINNLTNIKGIRLCILILLAYIQHVLSISL